MKSFFSLLQVGCGLALLASTDLRAATGTRGYTGTQVFSTAGGDKDEGEPNHCGEPGGASSWFFYRAPRSGVMVVDTRGSSFDTVLAVYIGPGTSYATLTNVACNNDSNPSNTWSKVVFNVTSNVMYYMAVDGVGGVSGTVKLNYQLGDSLLITNQPQSLVRAAGRPAAFTVAAAGTGILSYQWLYNGAPINSATQATLTLPAVQLSDEGAYAVLVQDTASALLSSPASLMVCGQLPATNSVRSSQVAINGTNCLRVVAHAASGSVLEASEDLAHWLPLETNSSSHGLFAIDALTDRPQRFFRIRFAP